MAGSVVLAGFLGYAVIPDAVERRSPASFRRAPSGLPAVALTFDDGPHPELTPRVLEALARAEAHATFFVVGENVRRYPALVREAVAAGHALGVHTWTHRHAWLCTPGRQQLEVRRGWEAIVDATGRRPLWFRPPYGAFNAVTRRVARELGLAVALWSCDAGDWLPGATARGILRRVAHGLRPGAVIDLHDGGRTPLGCRRMTEVLPEILAEMRARGLRGVHLGELVGWPAFGA
jgi:peptidoglycan/xylan/chitin deacetylase (PgdA/CDA1 family)